MTSEHQALYRRYRPKNFAGIIGQEHITTILRRQVANETTAHAYLFCGTRGTGKTSTARIFARALNCRTPKDGEPCGTCDICTSPEEALAVDIVELDAASHNGVDDIRDIRDKAGYAPALCRYKIYIIDEAHMLSNQAFNALLKTLEEPPGHVKFILATTEPAKLPATILSRCQRYDFKRVPQKRIEDLLMGILNEEGRSATPEAVRVIATAAEGSVRDSLSILDQCLFTTEGILTEGEIVKTLGTFDQQALRMMIDQMHRGEIMAPLQAVQNAYDDGKDLAAVARDLLTALCDEMMSHPAGQAQAFYTRAISILGETVNTLRITTQQRAILSAALVRIVYIEPAIDSEAILQRIERLETALAQGMPDKTSAMQKKTCTVQAEASPEQKENSALEDLPPWEETIPEEPPVVWEDPAPYMHKEFIAENPDSNVLRGELHIFPEAEIDAVDAEAGEIEKDITPVQMPGDGMACYRKFLSFMQKNCVPAYSILKKGQFKGVEEDEAIISFEPKDELAIHMLKIPSNETIIKSALAESFGKQLRVRYVVAQFEEPELLRKARKELDFDIEIVD